MIELFEQDQMTNDRQSSKGNQLKWKNNGWWYKADYTGYEGLAEYVVSELLKKTNLGSGDYVVYEVEEIKYKNKVFKGVKSKNFLEGEWQIITLERLINMYFGQSLQKAVWNICENKARLEFLVAQVEKITGLSGVGNYINKLLTLDAFFLNEDRHTHNIAVLMNGQGEYRYSPIFDNGASLLSDTTMDYPMEEDVNKLMKEVKAKTICQSFDEQLDASEELYGRNLKFGFTEKDIKDILEKDIVYPAEEKARVESIILAQMRKYKYLFML